MTLSDIVTLTSIGSIVVGWCGSLLFMKIKRKKEDGLANQEVKRAEDLDIRNTENLIKLYRTSVDDFQKLIKSRESEYLNRLKDYESRFNHYKKLYEDTQSKLNKLQLEIESFKAKLEILSKQATDNCNDCDFKSECKKYNLIKYDGNNSK